MEYKRVIVSVGDYFESVDKPLAERLLADSIQVDLSHVGRVRVGLRIVFPVRGAHGPCRGAWERPGAERCGIVPGADLPEQVNLSFRVPRTSQVDDGPRADVLFEPGNVGVVHLVERRASKHAPPRDGAAVLRLVAT